MSQNVQFSHKQNFKWFSKLHVVCKTTFQGEKTIDCNIFVHKTAW